MSLVFQACLVIVNLKLGEIHFRSINTELIFENEFVKMTCLEN